jgi:hypothetical protein
VQQLGLPKLTSEQIEQLCCVAETAARKHVLSKVPSKKVEALNISAETEGEKPVRLTVEVDIRLSNRAENSDLQKLSDEAVKEAFASAERYLRELICHSQT